MAADEQAGQERVAPGLQSRVGGGAPCILIRTGAKGLGSSIALWKTAQGLVSEEDRSQQSLGHLPGLMLAPSISSSCCLLAREEEDCGMLTLAHCS